MKINVVVVIAVDIAVALVVHYYFLSLKQNSFGLCV